MKHLFIATLGVVLYGLVAAQGQEAPQPLKKLVQNIAVPGVQGRIDDISCDVKGKCLFMPALGNKSVEVFDLAAAKQLHTITGIAEPQEALFVPESELIFVADGKGGTI